MSKKKSDSLALKVLTNPLGVTSVFIITAFILFGIFGPILSPWDPSEPDIYATLADPSAEHWFGTDSAGRDVLTRLAVSTRFSLATASVAVLVALACGVVTGLIAGYFGGWFDNVASWFTSIIMALPGLVVLLAAITVIGPSMWYAMMIFGVLMSPAYFRLVYTTVRGVRNELYVDAARVAASPTFASSVVTFSEWFALRSSSRPQSSLQSQSQFSLVSNSLVLATAPLHHGVRC